ncbi:fam-c protein [Plasmodium vinckei brucechwatti]|uniref:Fam-c protein n=1 Tax=Plasmodium vinckei brucechwatti TaxID=119398 RepID=A0A6V7S8B2_PLAVN|nr:fam-c protein [Plasmodium vinckei brucechwatti]
MNKRIFSLVCIVLYSLLAVSIHCSEQKVSNVGNKSVCDTKEINRGDEKSGIEFKHETELNNKNNSDPNDDEGYKDDIDDKDGKGNKNSDCDGRLKPRGYWFYWGSNNMVMGYGFRHKF